MISPEDDGRRRIGRQHDLHVLSSLNIGDAPALAAKLRLLRKAPPFVDIIASKKAQWRAEFATDTGVCWLAELDR